MQNVQGKLPPQAIDLEEVILGALLVEKNAILEIVDILDVEAFYKEEHQIIYKTILELFEANSPVEIATVTHLLRKNKVLDKIGGGFYLIELSNRVSSSANIIFHAYKVRELYVQRKVIEYTHLAHLEAYEYGADPFEIIENLQNDLFEMVSEGMKKGVEKIDSVILKAIKQIEINSKSSVSSLTVPSGLTSLDKIIGGFNNSDLVIVAARPGMGKTAFALTIARNAAHIYKKKVLVFSIEMSSVQLAMRMLASEAEIDSFKIKNGDLEPYEWQIVLDKASNIENMDIYIDESNLTINDLVAKVRRLHQMVDIDMIVIDYLQIVSTKSFRGNREQEVAFIARKLKGLAKEIGRPVIALAQLSRATEQRANKRPMLSDLKESGSIEAEADLVMFIHRDEYYGNLMDEDGTSTLGKADIIIAKHRHGSIGDVKLEYKAPFVKFLESSDKADLFHQDVVYQEPLLPITNQEIDPNNAPF